MWSADSTYAVLLASGLLGGFGHCIAMCGPFVAALALGPGRRGELLPHALYNLGRVTTYALLGGAVGLSGSFVRIAVPIEPFQKAVLAGTGVLIMILGLAIGGWIGRKDFAFGRFDPTKPFPRIVHALADQEGIGAFYPLGMVLGFLPCGIVYAALLSAARVGMEAKTPAEGFLRGLLAMALFGAGTVPSLLLIGKAAGLLGGRLRSRLYRIAALLLVALGGIYAARGLLR
ncbi:MAG: sulfite exporter TauE/SafE family protein [Deltaproteobacteria bacterium]|nr:sulfite exporter TauE/SafE family protein [Deltaproteobacteria bacterium]